MEDILGAGPLILRGAELAMDAMKVTEPGERAIGRMVATAVAATVDPVGTATSVGIRVLRDLTRGGRRG